MREIAANLLNENFVDFFKSLRKREVESIMVGGAPTQLLSVQNLKKAKIAAGRHRDLDDLEHLS